MSEDNYMKDPRAKTVEAFIAGLNILAKYMKCGLQESYFCTAEHDEIFIFVGLDDCPPVSDDGIELQKLGFHASSADNWGYFT